jgi:hypothetical protein
MSDQSVSLKQVNSLLNSVTLSFLYVGPNDKLVQDKIDLDLRNREKTVLSSRVLKELFGVNPDFVSDGKIQVLGPGFKWKPISLNETKLGNVTFEKMVKRCIADSANRVFIFRIAAAGFTQSKFVWTWQVSHLFKKANPPFGKNPAAIKELKRDATSLWDEYKHVMVTQTWSCKELQRFSEYLNKLVGIVVLDEKKRQKIGEAGVVNLTKMIAREPPTVLTGSQKVDDGDGAAIFNFPGFNKLLKLAFGFSQTDVSKEIQKLKLDSKRMGKKGDIQNKNARQNWGLVSQTQSVSSQELKRGYKEVKHPKNHDLVFKFYLLNHDKTKYQTLLRHAMQVLAGPFGYKFQDLLAEGNYYADGSKNGIGFHGDVERGGSGKEMMKSSEHTGTVVGFSGGARRDLAFCSYFGGKPIGVKAPADSDLPDWCRLKDVMLKKTSKLGEERISTTYRYKVAAAQIGQGSWYIMSSKAIGKDWKKGATFATWRHAAGATTYTKIVSSQATIKKGQPSFCLTWSAVSEHDSSAPELQEQSALSLNFPDSQKVNSLWTRSPPVTPATTKKSNGKKKKNSAAQPRKKLRTT